MNKEITEIQYFPNGMPSLITFGNGIYPYGRIAYAPISSMQDSSFVERHTVHTQYPTYSISTRKNNTISFFWIPEGRAINTGDGYDYEYFLKDHLSNTRVVFGMLDETDIYTATMETTEYSLQIMDFSQYVRAYRIRPFYYTL